MGEVVPFGPRRVRSNAAGVAGRRPDRRDAGAGGVAAEDRRPIGAREPARAEPLWRAVSGAVLADERRRQRRTLAQVATRAGMSVQYLSELERGRKEASSEMLSAACGSLGLTLAEFASRCSGVLRRTAGRPSGPTLMAA